MLCSRVGLAKPGRAIPTRPLTPTRQCHRCRNTSVVVVKSQLQNGGDPRDKTNLEASVKRLMNAAGKAGDEVARALTPREAYDVMDWVLMIASTFIFIWLAAVLYSMYAHMYYSMGFTTIRDMLS